jgi:hypothetical protein
MLDDMERPPPIHTWSRHAAAAGLVATILVMLAVFGPPATGQRIAPLLGLRHEILMMDREFERFILRASPSSLRAGRPISAELGRLGSANDRSRMQARGGVS